MRESFETGSFDTIPTAPTSNLHLSRAVANGILPRARHKRYTKNSILEVMCDRGLVIFGVGVEIFDKLGGDNVAGRVEVYD